MTKKDYIKLAKLIKDNQTGIMDDEVEARLGIHQQTMYTHSFLEGLCDILKQDNPNFDKQRFMEACK